MTSHDAVSRVAALIADPARSEMLIAMMGGAAFPASELAAIAHIAPSTASHHLASLVEGGLVEVFSQGRHRYHRLAGPNVAELLESLGSFNQDYVQPRKLGAAATRLAYCRSCYDHLAGELSIDLRCSLEKMNCIRLETDRFELTEDGVHFFRDLGINVEELSDRPRPLAKACLDWTERVPHLGGQLGAALFSRFLERKWVERGELARLVRVTPLGWDALHAQFGILPSQTKSFQP